MEYRHFFSLQLIINDLIEMNRKIHLSPRYKVLLLILSLSISSLLGQEQAIKIDIKNFDIGNKSMNKVHFCSISYCYDITNKDSVIVYVSQLPSLIKLSTSTPSRFHPKKFIWVETPEIKVEGSLKRPKGISISPTNKEQEIADQLAKVMKKNKTTDSELVFSRTYYYYLNDNLFFQDTAYIRRIVSRTPDSLKEFWGAKLLEQYIDDLDHLGYDPQTKRITHLSAINKSNEKQKVEFIGEKYTLLDFASIGCAPCLREIDDMVEIYDKYRTQLEIVMLWDERNYEGWMKSGKKQKDKITWISLLDNNMSIYKKFNILYLPTHILLDKNGYIIDECYGQRLSFIVEYLEANL